MIALVGRALLAIFGVAAFLLPGWLIVRWIRAPWPVLTSFLASCVLWFHAVLWLNALGAPLHRETLLGTWVGLSALLALLTWRRASREPLPALPRPLGLEWLWFACAAFGLVSIAARAVLDPLSGWDNPFRWDYLARALLAVGHLNFYPPITAADFEIYSWCDGIPPLPSLLNAWLYLVTGESAAVLTAPRVIGEALLVGAAVFACARTLWGERGGWPAAGLAGTSALLLWGVAQAQEIGVLTIAALVMLGCLLRLRSEPHPSLAMWAGVAAAVAALNREYALLLPVLGGAFVALSPTTRRLWPAFALPAVGLCATWYLRNALHTGNLLYPQTVGGLFPGNVFFEDVMARIGQYWRLDGPHVRLGTLAATLAVVGGAALVAGAGAAWASRRRSLLPLAAVATFALLWWWSVRMTAGGINYSLRVLTPAVAVLAVLGGGLANLPCKQALLCAIAALLFAGDAARRAWLLPVDPLTSPWPYTWSPWADVRNAVEQGRSAPHWQWLVDHAQGSLVAVDSPGAHAEIVRRGGRASMLFSPIFRPCFDPALASTETIARLRKAGVRLIMLHVGDPVAHGLLARHPFFRRLVEGHAPALEGPGYRVYDLAAPEFNAP